MPGPFKPNDPPTSIPLPQALPRAPTARMIGEIPQARRVQPQRSFVEPIGDTRTDFPPPRGAVLTGYPSSEVAPGSLLVMTQPTVPEIVPLHIRKMK
jgi:hypothetical protein